MTGLEQIGCVEAEAAFLSVLLQLRGEHLLGSLLRQVRDDDLSEPRNRSVLAAARAVHGRGEPVDPVTVLGELRRSGLEQSMTSDREAGVYLADLLPIGNPGSVGAYVDVLLEHSLRRDIVTLGQRMVQVAGTADLDTVRSVIREGLPALAEQFARVNHRLQVAS